jgi:hypothetical protein
MLPYALPGAADDRYDRVMIWRPILVLTLFGTLMARPGAAIDDPCARLFVPEGYGLTCTLGASARGDWQVTVQPAQGPFASLSQLTLEPVDEPVDDPEVWLRERVRFDLSGVAGLLRAQLDSPDNPFAGSALEPLLRQWIEGVEYVANLPLQSCREPAEIAAGTWQIACEWRLLEFEKYLTVRLVERDGQSYAMVLNAMNPRRMRHLVAIANSF